MARLNAFLLCAGLLLSATPALAADPADASTNAYSPPPPERVVALIVFGDDPCPRSSSDEIVVCGREPENERYRIPKRLRGKKKPLAAQEAWSNTVRELDYVSRAGLPDSCSPVGSGGATGCYERFISQARTERRQAKEDPTDQQ